MFGDLVSDLARAVLSGDPLRQARALEDLTAATADVMALSDLLGRRRALLFLDRIGVAEALAAPARIGMANVPALPAVPFLDAIRDLIERSIEIVRDTLRPRWRAVQRIYRERHAFALARSYSRAVTSRVRERIADLMAMGLSQDRAVRELERQFGTLLHPWTFAYGETVYRTNLNTAYNAGLMRQTRESPVMRRAFPAYECQGVADADERGNHAPVRGVIADTESPIWGRFSPPLGYNCRHSLRMVPFSELQDRGLVRRNGSVMAFVPPGPPTDDMRAVAKLVRMGAAPDYPSFGLRPDRRVYG